MIYRNTLSVFLNIYEYQVLVKTNGLKLIMLELVINVEE